MRAYEAENRSHVSPVHFDLSDMASDDIILPTTKSTRLSEKYFSSPKETETDCVFFQFMKIGFL